MAWKAAIPRGLDRIRKFTGYRGDAIVQSEGTGLHANPIPLHS